MLKAPTLTGASKGMICFCRVELARLRTWINCQEDPHEEATDIEAPPQTNQRTFGNDWSIIREGKFDQAGRTSGN